MDMHIYDKLLADAKSAKAEVLRLTVERDDALKVIRDKAGDCEFLARECESGISDGEDSLRCIAESLRAALEDK